MPPCVSLSVPDLSQETSCAPSSLHPPPGPGEGCLIKASGEVAVPCPQPIFEASRHLVPAVTVFGIGRPTSLPRASPSEARSSACLASCCAITCKEHAHVGATRPHRNIPNILQQWPPSSPRAKRHLSPFRTAQKLRHSRMYRGFRVIGWHRLTDPKCLLDDEGQNKPPLGDGAIYSETIVPFLVAPCCSIITGPTTTAMTAVTPRLQSPVMSLAAIGAPPRCAAKAW